MKGKQRKFEQLRRLMAVMGVTYADICDAWNAEHPTQYKYTTYLSDLMCGKKDWKLSMCYFVLDFMEIPHTMLNYYFPKGGESDDSNEVS